MKKFIFFVFFCFCQVTVFGKLVHDYTYGKLKDKGVHYIDFTDSSTRSHKIVFLVFKKNTDNEDIFDLVAYQEDAYKQAAQFFLKGGAKIADLVLDTLSKELCYHTEIAITESIYDLLNRSITIMTIGTYPNSSTIG